MSEIVKLEWVLWGLSFFLNVGLVFLLLFTRNFRAFPLFSIYSASVIVQNIAFFEAYKIWGFNSSASIRLAWGTQVLVIIARAFAVAEICYCVSARFGGIWKVARLLLMGTGTAVALLACAFSHGSLRSTILSLDRGLELAIASVIVVLFLFAWYYDLGLEPAVRRLATGFFVYSAFSVLDNTIAERWLTHSTTLWNLFGTFTFLVSLLLWMRALRLRQERGVREPELLPESLYREVSPAINARLKALNDQLSHFWRIEGEKT